MSSADAFREKMRHRMIRSEMVYAHATSPLTVWHRQPGSQTLEISPPQVPAGRLAVLWTMTALIGVYGGGAEGSYGAALWAVAGLAAILGTVGLLAPRLRHPRLLLRCERGGGVWFTRGGAPAEEVTGEQIVVDDGHRTKGKITPPRLMIGPDGAGQCHPLHYLNPTELERACMFVDEVLLGVPIDVDAE